MGTWRKPTRLPHFDYSQPGAYFVTVCVEKRLCCLSTIRDGCVQLTPRGEISDRFWRITQNHFNGLRIDSHVTMPNHVHAIVMIYASCRGGVTPPLHNDYSLGNVIGFYKYQTTKQINLLTQTPGQRFWQRNYYDHVIRDEDGLERHRRYILENPLRWELDEYYATP